MKHRPPQKDDQEKCEKAYLLLRDLFNLNPHIEGVHAAAACWTILIEEYHSNGASYEQFANEVNNVLKHYKPIWEKYSNE